MMERQAKLIDLDVNDGKNIVDALLSLVNSAMLSFQLEQLDNGNVPSLQMYENIEKSILQIERKLQDLRDEYDKISPEHPDGENPDALIYDLLSIVAFLFSKKQFEAAIISKLEKYLFFLSHYVSVSKNLSDFHVGIHNIQPQLSQYTAVLNSHMIKGAKSLLNGKSSANKLLIDDLLRLLVDAINYYEEKRPERLSSRRTSAFIQSQDEIADRKKNIGAPTKRTSDAFLEKDYTFIITFSTASKNASQISYLMWVFSTGFETIEGVQVELSDWGRGSLWVKLAIKIKGWVSKSEFFSLLKRTAQSLHDHYFNPNKSKIEVETAILNAELERKPTLIQSQELQEIDIKSKQLDLEDKQLELQLKKLTLIKETTALFKDAIIRVDSDFNIHIGEILLCSRTNGQLEIGEGLDGLNEDVE
jgi:hypothetical protein